MKTAKKVKGYTVEIATDSEGSVCVWIEKGAFSASLSMLLMEGLLWSRDGRPHKVPQVVQEQIHEFANDTLSSAFLNVNH